jgi:hypothetical protein
MTTRVHIVNFGPDVVEADRPNSTLPMKIYPQGSADFYVYDEQTVVVREVKPEPKVPQ